MTLWNSFNFNIIKSIIYFCFDNYYINMLRKFPEWELNNKKWRISANNLLIHICYYTQDRWNIVILLTDMINCQLFDRCCFNVRAVLWLCVVVGRINLSISCLLAGFCRPHRCGGTPYRSVDNWLAGVQLCLRENLLPVGVATLSVIFWMSLVEYLRLNLVVAASGEYNSTVSFVVELKEI